MSGNNTPSLMGEARSQEPETSRGTLGKASQPALGPWSGALRLSRGMSPAVAQPWHLGCPELPANRPPPSAGLFLEGLGS